jgi:hypothetical protein
MFALAAAKARTGAALGNPVLQTEGRVTLVDGSWPPRIPGVEARLLDHDGHLTLLTNRVPEVHAWLKERM